jgi:putative glycosyltransferase
VDLSIVSTLYCSAPFVEEFCRRASAAARRITDDFEIVLVNDGSPDASLDLARSLQRDNPHIRIVDLSRNFGHHKAMLTGLSRARGDLVFQTDCDLEEDPELLATYLDELRQSGADVVYGVVRRREGSLLHVLSGRLFYSLFNLLSSAPLTPGLTMTRLMTRRYVDALLLHRDQQLFMAGLWSLAGFNQRALIVDKRRKGSSTYTLGRKIALFVTSITSFSVKPLAFIFVLGTAISALAILAALALIVRAVLYGGLLVGWASVIVSIWLLGGLTILSIGIIGIYLATVFVETKPRPFTIIRDEYVAAGEPVQPCDEAARLTAVAGSNGGPE